MERSTVDRSEITGIVLAGGQGRRMGGVDKGLVSLAGRPLVAHVLERLTPQVGSIIINANQNLRQYQAFGYRVVADAIGGFAGPLAGLQAGLSKVTGRSRRASGWGAAEGSAPVAAKYSTAPRLYTSSWILASAPAACWGDI